MISIVIPIYNAEKHLRECIDSVLEQDYTEFELLLVNDGSTDGSDILCNEIAACKERVEVIHQKNAGVSSARNAGIEHILRGGCWLCFFFGCG